MKMPPMMNAPTIEPSTAFGASLRGLRVSSASVEAVSWGWQHVYWFPGGVEEWTAKGYPLVVVAE